MSSVFVIPASSKLYDTIATIRPIIDGDPKVTRPLCKEIGIAYVDDVLAASPGALNVQAARVAAGAINAAIERAEAIKAMRQAQGRDLSASSRAGVERIRSANELLRSRVADELAAIDANDHRAAATFELTRFLARDNEGMKPCA